MDNKSLEYVRKRIRDGNCNNMQPEEFENMHDVPFTSYFFEGEYSGDYMILAVRNDNEEVLADLTYSPDAEFNYFITESCVCDGALMFMYDLMTKILNKITQLKTCYSPALENISKEEFHNGNYVLHYEVGDFVTNSYIIEPPDKDRLWMCDRFTVMLPVKFTIENRGVIK